MGLYEMATQRCVELDHDSVSTCHECIDWMHRLEMEAGMATLESSHAELLEALKFIKDMLAFYEGSEEKLEGADTLVAVINAQGSDGDFQMMLSEARQAIKNAEEKQ